VRKEGPHGSQLLAIKLGIELRRPMSDSLFISQVSQPTTHTPSTNLGFANLHLSQPSPQLESLAWPWGNLAYDNAG
jgi:hypothetical protein